MIKIPQIVKTSPNDIFNKAKGTTEPYVHPLSEIGYVFESDMYSVTVNGEGCPVRACRESAMPFNRWWPGKQRDLSQTEMAAFVTFSANEEVTVCVTPNRDFACASVTPRSKNVISGIQDKTIRFTLKEHGGYVLELGSSHNVLYIFFNEPKSYPEAENATYYFGPGLHFPGNIMLKDNDTVYIDEEAIVFGSLNSLGADNVRIYGGGILDNTYEERITGHCYENYTKGTFRIYNCNNLEIEDIILLNSSTWVISMFYCNNIVVDNVKIIGQWRYNTDGIDIVNSSNVTVKNSFIRSFDDSVSLKGIYDYDKPMENITVENCVLWCGWGHIFVVGPETHTPEYNNITLKSCDVLHTQYLTVGLDSWNDPHIHNVVVENLNVDLQSDTLLQVIQESDDMEYDYPVNREEQVLISITNKKNIGYFESGDGYDIHLCDSSAKICDVCFKNIRVYTDDDSLRPCITMKSSDENVVFDNISIDGLYLNDIRQNNLDSFAVTIEGCTDVTIDGAEL